MPTPQHDMPNHNTKPKPKHYMPKS